MLEIQLLIRHHCHYVSIVPDILHGFVFILLFIVYNLITLGTASKDLCSSFSCGNLTNISYPFSNSSAIGCGLSVIECVDDTPLIQFREKGKLYEVLAIFDQNKTIVIREKIIGLLALGVCKDVFYNFSVTLKPMEPSLPFDVISPYITIFECSVGVNLPYNQYSNCNNANNTSSLFYYDDSRPNDRLAPVTPEIEPKCNMFRFPTMSNLSLFEEPNNSSDDQFLSLLEAGFFLRWKLPAECSECEGRGINCLRDLDQFRCADFNPDSKAKFRRRLATGLGVGGTSMILVTFLLLFVYCRHRMQRSSSTLLTQNISSYPSSKKDLLKAQSTYFGAHVFSYVELEAATNNFDASKELGDGGYGTVYHGNLFDGREVAVKRLYENNYKRVEQFMNEIEIITHLHHKNLVTLYGCTSRHSRELLLVYEYISNGTVADHLHGDRTKLSWPIRMNIAIETASALSYLHASDIIHRDIKSSNILLDESFTVKVADFGLSRSFPSNVSHVSTAPQGSPGYVDPTYYQCYQLTEKSDVYSFGVLLIELISSKPAIDINRHQNEIILANWAINKIQKGEVHELADPYLGVESDDGVKKMVTLVAELAFRCLQQEKEVRPSMEEVVEALYGIENEEYKVEKSLSEEVEIPKENTAIA